MVLLSNNPTLKHSALIMALLPMGMHLGHSQTNSVVAQQEMQTLADGMDLCALDTTYYVSLENLNDLSQTNTTNPYDSIQNMDGVYTIIPSIGTFSTQRRNLATAFNAWNGPYVTFQQGRTQTDTTPYDQGSPLDPWGNPYYLFNPLGLIRGDQGIITLELYGDQFDRYTIVSLGPDGIVSGDDVIRQFGTALQGVYLTSLSGSDVTLTSPPDGSPTYDVAAGTTLTLRGLNFGPPAENKHVVFGTTVIEEVVSWTTREVTVRVPVVLAGTDGFAIQIGTSNTNSITATITGSHTKVEDWSEY